MGFNRDEILRKCRKLAAFKDGRATAAEVANAAALLRRMLEKYQLSMAEIEGGIEAEGCAEVVLFTCKRMARWQQHLAVMISVAFDCRALEKRKTDGTRECMIMGLASDVEVVGYFYNATINATLEGARELSREYGHMHNSKAAANRYLLSYMMGVGDAVAARLCDDRNRAEPQAAQSVNALIVVKDALIARHIEENYTQGRKKAKRRVGTVASAYVAGHRAGDSIALRQGITAG